MKCVIVKVRLVSPDKSTTPWDLHTFHVVVYINYFTNFGTTSQVLFVTTKKMIECSFVVLRAIMLSSQVTWDFKLFMLGLVFLCCNRLFFISKRSFVMSYSCAIFMCDRSS